MSHIDKTLNKTISQVWDERYVIPLYQRNFAWAEDQIGQLLQDLYDHAPKTEANKSLCDNYYLGSLVLLKRRDGKWEVIDGQQRLTALHLICRYLGILNSPRLSFDSRPTVERFLDNLFSNKSWDEVVGENLRTDDNKIIRLKDALSIMETYKIRVDDNGNYSTLKSMSSAQKKLMADYISTKVILVCTPLPEDTDVASYFEIMNNRGEQLQSHEIIKAILMRNLNRENRKTFAEIWDACSQMDIPVQRTLSMIRTKVFGDDFDVFTIEAIFDGSKSGDIASESYKIEEILSSDLGKKELVRMGNDDRDNKYRAIIDFPNFLMHVFRVYASKKGISSLPPLNSDSMPVSCPEYIEDSLDFAKFLLKIRVLFDRYVVKVQGVDDESEDLKWRMLKPYRDSENQLRFRNTFSKEDPTDYDEDSEASNSRIIKQQSMLQVTFRNRKYKEWLNALLTWLDKKTSDSINVDERELTIFLDTWIHKYYADLLASWKEAKALNEGKRDILSSGVNTPHFILNFIDYLYWLASKRGKSNIRYVNKLQDFQFRYYNSVEHHLPQSYELTDDVDIDMIGNLCLISRRKNSSLNDKGPTEKAKIEKGLQPKRRVMYEITQDNQHWGRKEIEAHQQDIVELLAHDTDLLMLN